MVQGENGLVVEMTPEAVAEGILRLMRDPALYAHIRQYQQSEGRETRGKFSGFSGFWKNEKEDGRATPAEPFAVKHTNMTVPSGGAFPMSKLRRSKSERVQNAEICHKYSGIVCLAADRDSAGVPVPAVLIYSVGVEYLGINGLMSNILTIFSLAESGIGLAIGYALYNLWQKTILNRSNR